MLSKLMTRMNGSVQLVKLSQKGFRASAVSYKKPSIGDAVTILQSKVSSINQVVSNREPKSPCLLTSILIFEFRTTSRNSEPSSPLEMVLPVFSDS